MAQNRTIKYNRDFEAQTSITVGNNIDTTEGKSIKSGDVIFKTGTTVNLKSPRIKLEAGTKVENGCVFKASN